MENDPTRIGSRHTVGKLRVILAGGAGFIGQSLASQLLAQNYEVVVLTRTPRARNDGLREIEWDGRQPGEWAKYLEGAEAVVNLAGKNINCPHTPENLRELSGSRVNSVRAIAAALENVKIPPRTWVQAGAIGFYGDSGSLLCDESAPSGADNLAEICRQWEGAFYSVAAPKTRKVLLRIGFVLGRDGGALPVLEKLTRWFLGGRVGSGKQFTSWIHVADLTRMFAGAIERENWSGTFNAVAPNPVTNGEFVRELRRSLHRPWSPPAPEWAVKIGSRLMKSEPSLALAGCRCVPKRLLEAGFRFQYPSLPDALKNLYE
jgi:uncharacterized protein (TIGR01777 family)